MPETVDFIPFVNWPTWLEGLIVMAVVYFAFVSVLAMFFIWWERKVSAHMQSRLGPMRTGLWHGWAQSPADGLKLLGKEDLLPDDADKPLFRLAAYLAFVPAFAALVVLPFSAKFVFVHEMHVSLVFIFGVLSLEIVGVMLAGWASNSKWALYGAIREACQVVSYEIPMGLSLLAPALTVGSLSLAVIGANQGAGLHEWLMFRNPFLFVAFFVFFIASLASCKRAPFDLPECESELVAGFLTEYSGMRWAMFFFAEYTVMYIIGALTAILFLGAWYDPFGIILGMEQAGQSWAAAVAGAGVMVVKGFTIVFVQMWLRWTLPRLRIDQVMYVCVKVFLPASCITLIGSAAWQWLAGGLFQQITQIVLTVLGTAGGLYFVALLARALVKPGQGILPTIITSWHAEPAPAPVAPAAAEEGQANG
ncbi:MAG: NADH-quinone oxidoreductase subunit NuoH [Planctomycetota bacterium]|nr:NADH-quinone oxidoreductase subunit NuoH [Planctomycetota bacterium]